MKIGVQLWPQATNINEMRAAWRTADVMKVDSIWTWDHFYPLSGDPEATHFECYSLLSAMAADTCHAQIGALVVAAQLFAADEFLIADKTFHCFFLT